jgi:hypothetical protein
MSLKPKSLSELTALRLAIKTAIANDAKETALSELLNSFIEGYGPLGLPENHEHIWWRARDKLPPQGRCDHVNELTYKPEGNDEYNRASRPRTEILYAGWNPIVALDEIRAKKGDLVHLTSVRVASKDTVIAHVVGAYQTHFATGRVEHYHALVPGLDQMAAHDHDNYMRQVFIDASLAEWFRERIEENAKNKYKVTALYSELIHSSGAMILYPSVQHLGGWSMAVPGQVFDAKFEVLDTLVVEVEESVGFGIYKYRPIHYSCTFKPDGVIDWSSRPPLQKSWTHKSGAQVAKDYRGWRKRP